MPWPLPLVNQTPSVGSRTSVPEDVGTQLRDQFNYQRLKSLTEKLDIDMAAQSSTRHGMENMSDIFNNFRLKSHSFGRNGLPDGSINLDRSIDQISHYNMLNQG